MSDDIFHNGNELGRSEHMSHDASDNDLVRICDGSCDSSDDCCSNPNLILYCNPLVLLPATGCNTMIPTSTTAHSLLEGKRLLFRALILMDTLCSSSIPEKEWDDFFTQFHSQINENIIVDAELERKCLQIGLRSRSNMINTLLQQYLIPDITNRWACNDQNRVQPQNNNTATTTDHSNINNNYVQIQHDNNTGNHNDSTTQRSYFHGNLIERSILSQITSGLLLWRNDAHTIVENICRYITSTMPSYDLDEGDDTLYNSTTLQQPPLLSFNTLESLLLLSDPLVVRMSHTDDIPDNANDVPSLSWFEHYITILYGDSNNLFYETVLLAINNAALLWEQQTLSANDHTRDEAAIELSSYRRLVQAFDKVTSSSQWPSNHKEKSRINNKNEITSLSHHNNQHYRTTANRMVQDVLSDNDGTTLTILNSETLENELCYWPLLIAVILGDNIPLLDRHINNKLQKPLNQQDVSTIGNFLKVLVTAKRQVELTRRCDKFKPMDTSFFTHILFELEPKITTIDISLQLQLFCTTLNCSVTIADGRSALFIVHHLLKIITEHSNSSKPNADWSMIQTTLQSIRRSSTAPVVRVINLERRKDRMRAFMVQAFRERLLVVKALSDVSNSETTEATDDLPRGFDGYEFGGSAIDGQGRLVEATARLEQHFGSMEIVNKYVEPLWRPNDLKPFDVDAPNSDALMVRISPSERACALSHILSWKGVLRSLQSATKDSSLDSHLLRLYKISGYAQGPALLKENHSMPPTPVCVILEDDAILVDRFTDRLDEILYELPRDFHFCSLGYSRPKSAPIVPFSDHIGIPSMLWYLTGYCISAAGAQYLLDTLPVVGPVDSCIGLKMTSNWDNTFGVRLGVGDTFKTKVRNAIHP